MLALQTCLWPRPEAQQASCPLRGTSPLRAYCHRVLTEDIGNAAFSIKWFVSLCPSLNTIYSHVLCYQYSHSIENSIDIPPEYLLHEVNMAKCYTWLDLKF